MGDVIFLTEHVYIYISLRCVGYRPIAIYCAHRQSRCCPIYCVGYLKLIRYQDLQTPLTAKVT